MPPSVPASVPEHPVLAPLLSYREASALLAIPVGTLYALVHQKRIPHIRLSGRMVRFHPDALHAWLEERIVSVTTHNRSHRG